MMERQVMRCGDTAFQFGTKTYIMGILNVTPDSFSDGGRYNAPESALRHAREMIEAGADLLDIGGESTRPGAVPLGLHEELDRVIPVIRYLRENGITRPISVDTYKAEVARQALAAGADIVNDVWGMRKDPDMGAVAAETGCPIVLMHNRTDRSYGHFVNDVIADLRESAQLARHAGIADSRIILDPGIGFAKDYTQNLCIMNHLREIADLGYPVLLGTSRKRMIATALGLPVDELVEGTAATVVLGIAQGCDIARVHDVKAVKRAAMMADAIVRNRFDAKTGERHG